MKRQGIILLIFLIVNRLTVLAQEGDYFLTQHPYDNNRFDTENFAIEQDNNGLIYVANKNGVLRYDGRTWDLVSCPGSVYDILVTSQNQVYVAGKMGFGYLQYTMGLSTAQYIALPGKVNPEGVFRIEQLGDSILFLGSEELYVYRQAKRSVSKIASPEDDHFVNMFFLTGKLVLQTQNKSFYTIRRQQLIPVDTGLPADAWIVFATESPENNGVSLVGTHKNELYWLRNGNAIRVNAGDSGYIEKSELTSCRWVNKDLLAIGTLRGGVVFLKATGALDKIVNFHTGLPDNEVYTLGIDRDMGIWVAHVYGFTRVAPALPFRCYSNFSGLEGNLLSVMPFESTVYIGTSTGLYFLETVKDAPVTITHTAVKRNIPTSKQVAVQSVKPAESAPAEKTKRKRFAFLRSRKKREAAQAPVVETVALKKDANDFHSRMVVRSRQAALEQNPDLRVARYRYRPVAGYSGKSPSLKLCKNSIIAGGSGGLYEVHEGKAVKIDGEHTLAFACNEDTGEIVSFTASHIVKIFLKNSSSSWSLHASRAIDDEVVHINNGLASEIWLSGRNAIYRLKQDSAHAYSKFSTLRIENPYNDNVYSFLHNGKVYFIASHDCFYFDPGRNILLHDREIRKQLGKIERVILSNENIWVYHNAQWTCLSDQTIPHDGLNVLGFFKQIKSLYAQHDGQFWVTTGTNELYKIAPQAYSGQHSLHKVLLKQVRSKDGKLLPVSDLKVEQDDSSLAFDFIHPDYLGLLGIQYQYKLDGLSDRWTDWTPDASLSYQLLPAGPYDLHVRIRDALGETSEEHIIHFKVVPPYWKTSWFYSLEILFFGSLLLITFRLNRKENRYAFLSRVLTFLTLILIIELIQNLAAGYWATDTSPVVNFFVQAVIALMVYPVEKLLRKFLSGNKAG
ncbi:MAG TPA: triple tyrosine motif-containing protein [Ohtaekwangia sp.]|uniref:triple tyrosine motif-containing protein n=1 Tax=Ohtaekwangia sp. TaxID=2066019 RepID=UPI002F944F0E